ncbi:MAG TPA: 4Fe-4S double cluster binding domain-containing protein, partial [Ohtaekwangia sp.]|nr:4Fe-4S double cluster binding domain-containing protein [Ohtaekwangia sp.]
DYCGSCTKCIEACPTGAILPGKVVNGSQCISYYTIELKEMLIPDEVSGKFNNWAFGCDICQDVCPWNRFAVPNNEPAFTPDRQLQMTSSEWQEMTEEVFRAAFRKSALKRTGFKGLMRNLKFVREA